jgi:hypothetical protein
MDKIHGNIKKRKECGVYENDSFNEVDHAFSEISSTEKNSRTIEQFNNKSYRKNKLKLKIIVMKKYTYSLE